MYSNAMKNDFFKADYFKALLRGFVEAGLRKR
jgi:hypothetical protein